MTRWKFLATLLTPWLASAQTLKRRRKYYVTDPTYVGALRVIETYGTDRTDAIINAGLAAFTEDEWQRADLERFEFGHYAVTRKEQ